MSRLVAACLLLSIWALTGSAGESDATVVMQRADGSKQCEPKPDSRAVSKMVSRAKAELKNSQVRALELKRLESDGKMRIQLCGSPSGAVIRIAVRKTDVERARALGYQPTEK